MKKALILLTALMLTISAIALPAMAEEAGSTTDPASPAVDQTTGATTQTGRGSHGGRNPGRGQTPGQQNTPNNQTPKMPGPDSQMQPVPGQNGRKGFRGNNVTGRMEKMEKWLAQLVTDGVITQETADAILARIKELAAQTDAVPAAESAETPSLPDGTALAEAGEPPALPDGSTPEEAPEARLLKEMLDSGIITQEQYDQFISRFSAPAAAEAEGTGI